MSWRWTSQNTFGMWTVPYWTRSSRTQFGVSINVWRLAGDTLNITCNFLYRNHQVHRDFLITLYFLLSSDHHKVDDLQSHKTNSSVQASPSHLAYIISINEAGVLFPINKGIIQWLTLVKTGILWWSFFLRPVDLKKKDLLTAVQVWGGWDCHGCAWLIRAD